MKKILCTLLLAGVPGAADPVFPYGAVYFRKSNPPEQDGERDRLTAARMGMNRFRHYARIQGIGGRVVHSNIGGSSATGGFPGLCLDNEDVRALAEKFLAALVARYKNHSATYGYDLCYCPATQRKLREWRKSRYKTVEDLGGAWGRYSYPDWSYMHPPRNFSGYAESLDWLAFRIDGVFRLLHWRSELFRRLDPKNHIAARRGGLGDNGLFLWTRRVK